MPRLSPAPPVSRSVAVERSRVVAGICNALGMSEDIVVVGGLRTVWRHRTTSARGRRCPCSTFMPRMDGFACLDVVTVSGQNCPSSSSSMRTRRSRLT
jgi:hypothetical protein